MNFWKKINQHNAGLLAAQINSNGGNAEATAESIINNLSKLAETGESYGEETKFIRLDILRTLGTLCDTGRLVFKVEPSTIRWEEDSVAVSVGGYLYEIREDGTEVRVSGFSCGGAARSDVYEHDIMSDAQRASMMLSLASSRAERNAFFNAGIGIEFKGDVFDLEKIEEHIPAPQPVAPSPESKEEKKAKRASRAKKAIEGKKEPEAKDVLTEAVEVVPEPEDTEIEVAFNEPASDEMTYEDALKITVDCGTYKGSTIGEILSKPQTARNIVWCLKQEIPGRSEELKTALNVAIKGYSDGALERFI